MATVSAKKKNNLSVIGCSNRLQILVYISKNPGTTATAIVNRFNISQPGVSVILRRMRVNKFVTSYTDQNNIRSIKYKLTKHGAAALDRVRALLEP